MNIKVFKNISVVTFLYFFPFCLKAQQWDERRTIKYYVTSFSDTSNNGFFRVHPSVSRFAVRFVFNKPYGISVYFKDDKPLFKSEYYDLEYEVDAYLFMKLYGPVHFPLSPREDTIQNDNDSVCNKCKIKTAVIYPDSVRCSLIKPSEIRDFRRTEVLASPVKYRNIESIGKRILLYNKQTLKSADSIIVFRGIVNNKGVLSDLELLVGKESAYSSQVEKDLLTLFNDSWESSKYLETGRAHTSYIKIYIRLNRDRTVKVLLSPRKMLNITGR